MEKMSVHDKAIRLCEGGHVEIDGHIVRLVRCVSVDNICSYCKMDNICRMKMTDICAECSAIIKGGCMLELVE